VKHLLSVTLAVALGILSPQASSAQNRLSPVNPAPAQEQIVYDHSRQACETWDVSDASVRAFRDFKGLIHLVTSSSKTRALTGQSFSNLSRDCAIMYSARGSANPADMDDEGWLESFYTGDGQTVYSLVSMDYHPNRHHLPCGDGQADASKCWYSSIQLAISKDGGNHFYSQPEKTARLVIGPDRRYSAQTPNTSGGLVPTNIVRTGRSYSMLTYLFDKEGGRECLLQTERLDDAKSWRGWSGQDFSVRFLDPYSTTVGGAGTCTTIAPGQFTTPVRSLLRVSDGRGYVAITFEPDKQSPGSANVVLFQSSDLISWRRKGTLIHLPAFNRDRCIKTGQTGYQYPSLIDEQSNSRNFDSTGRSAFVYLTRFNDCKTNWDVVKFPVNLPLD
jgi:hypothetical protein